MFRGKLYLHTFVLLTIFLITTTNAMALEEWEGKPLESDVPLHSLAAALVENGIDLGGIDTPNIMKAIRSSYILNDPEVFCIAYYLDDGSDRARGNLYIHLLRKKQNRWVHGEIDFEALFGKSHYVQRNSISGINYSRDYVYLFIFGRPQVTLVLSDDLEYQYALRGRVLATFDDGRAVYHKSQIRSAPTYYAEMSIYSPRTKRSRKIYPRKPYQRVRLEHTRKVKAAYDRRGKDWFRNHNHHMNPELFNNHVAGVVVNGDTNSLAFVIAYDNKDFWSDEDILRLRSFRELRREVKEVEIESPLPDSLFIYLDDDLGNIRRRKRQSAVLKLFEDDRELHKMLQDALGTEIQNGEDWRPYFNSLDAKWEDPEIWKRILYMQVGPEFTRVAYIYRNVGSYKEMAYKEILLSELKERYGDIPLAEYLVPERLSEIFDPQSDPGD
ncbi:hypothetical protein ACFL6S_29570 [Candidatus Poribacteria bacterium]